MCNSLKTLVYFCMIFKFSFINCILYIIGQPTYFSKEFPKLGGKGGEGGMEKSGDQGNNQGVNPQEIDHQNYASKKLVAG